MNRPSELSTKTLSNAPKQDLRTWIAQMEAAGELQKVHGANREEEIGGIVDIYQRQANNKAVLFDDIPGYPSGYRALSNFLTSTRRIRMTLGIPADASDMELIQWWRKYMKEVKTIPPVTVPTGLVLENVARGDDVNLLKIPAPKWHEHDGGHYIGTGDMVIMRHPDTGLDQLRRLSGAGARQAPRDRDVLKGQARRHDHAALSGARAEVSDRGGVRHASGAVHDRGPRDSLRQERV